MKFTRDAIRSSLQRMVRRWSRFAWEEMLFDVGRVEWKYGRNDNGTPNNWTEWNNVREHLREAGKLRQPQELESPNMNTSATARLAASWRRLADRCMVWLDLRKVGCRAAGAVKWGGGEQVGSGSSVTPKARNDSGPVPTHTGALNELQGACPLGPSDFVRLLECPIVFDQMVRTQEDRETYQRLRTQWIEAGRPDLGEWPEV